MRFRSTSHWLVQAITGCTFSPNIPNIYDNKVIDVVTNAGQTFLSHACAHHTLVKSRYAAIEIQTIGVEPTGHESSVHERLVLRNRGHFCIFVHGSVGATPPGAYSNALQFEAQTPFGFVI